MLSFRNLRWSAFEHEVDVLVDNKIVMVRLQLYQEINHEIMRFP